MYVAFQLTCTAEIGKTSRRLSLKHKHDNSVPVQLDSGQLKESVVGKPQMHVSKPKLASYLDAGF